MEMQQQLAALLDVSNPSAFEQMIITLTNPTNEVRKQAENLYTECKKNPNPCVQQLVQVLRKSAQDDARAMCAVLLRKVLTNPPETTPDNSQTTVSTVWTLLPENVQAGIKSELLQHISVEQNRSILKKVCDTVSEIAAGILESGGWPELLPFMFQCVQAPNNLQKESALLIFGQLAYELTEPLQQHFATLQGLLASSMGAEAVFDVRVAALKATTNFILTQESGNKCDKFQALVPSMLETLAAALNQGKELEAQEALEALIEVADNNPRFLRRQLESVLNTMVMVAEAENLEDATRNYAVEFLLTLAEAREKAPGMLRKAPAFVQRLFQCLLGFLLDVEDDAAWHTVDDDDDEEGQGERYDVGQEGLDRLALAMGGKTILPLASQMLPLVLEDADWKKRNAGLIALSQIAEGCAKLMLTQLEAVTDLILARMGDPHPRVRWSAIHAVGQLCTDLGPDLQKSQHARILSALLSVMDDHQHPRVQAHASAAVVNFSENCSTDIMRPYMDVLISKLMVLLQSGRKLVMEGALTALASVADCAQLEFQKYYDAVMPFLKNILVTATDKTHRMLRAKSMECISLVGMAVGKERFRSDAVEVMQVLVQLQNSPMEDDDPAVSYMLQAWARLCKCLGKDFLPYLPTVMPPLLKSAGLKTDVLIKDLDEENDNEDDDEWETIELGDKRISIKTSVLEEKATACNMLYCYADELKEGFYPYVEEVMKMMVPLLKFYVHEEVRKAAVSALPELINGAQLAVQQQIPGLAPNHDMNWVKSMVDYVLESLPDAVRKEPETEIVSAMLEALNELVTVAGHLMDMDPQMKAKQMDDLLTMFKEVLDKSFERTAERAQRQRTEDFDEEELEALQEENEAETDIFDQIAECIGSFLKKFGPGFLPLLDQMMQTHIMPLLDAKRAPEERRFALCIFCDVCEHASEGGANLRYVGVFLPHAIAACADSSAEVRQAAAYGLGQVAQRGGESVHPHIPQIMQALSSLIQAPNSRDPDSEPATDNAVSAVGKVCEFCRAAFPVEQALAGWLAYLPVKEDKEEALIVHEHLVRMTEQNDTALLGANHENLPKIVSVFAQIVGTDLVAEDVGTRIKALIMNLQTSMPPEQLQSLWSQIPPEQQQSLQACMAAPASA